MAYQQREVDPAGWELPALEGNELPWEPLPEHFANGIEIADPLSGTVCSDLLTLNEGSTGPQTVYQAPPVSTQLVQIHVAVPPPIPAPAPNPGPAPAPPPAPAARIAKHSRIETERRLDTGVVANYDSLLFTKPELVNSWKAAPFSYSNNEITHVLQYFEQLSQVKSQDYVDRLLELRRPGLVANPANWDPLDPLDPLRRCPSGPKNPSGVPMVGTILGRWASEDVTGLTEGPRPQNNPMQQYKSGTKNYQLQGYRNHWDCLPIGTTCLQILTEYPNHITYDFLDSFLQNGFSPSMMDSHVPDAFRNDMADKGVIKMAGITNTFKKRLDKRLWVLLQKKNWSANDVDAFLKADIKIRAAGIEIDHLDDITCSAFRARVRREQ
jgi:hypothetical protein